MVREAKLSWSDLGSSSVSEIGLRKLWDNADDQELPLISDDTSASFPVEKSSQSNNSASQKSARRTNGRKNLADADWMNWI